EAAEQGPVIMDTSFGPSIPETLEELCAPSRAALLVNDMQAGIVSQLPTGDVIVERVGTLVRSARAAGMRIVYSRHYNVPLGWAGVGQLRMAKTWQRARRASDLRPVLQHGSADFQIVDALAPRPEDVVLDKVTMSAFEGTPLALLMRDLGLCSVVLAGIALEVGIEPTARHGADLGFIPVVVQDACGSGHEDAAERSIAALRFAGDSVLTDLTSVCNVLQATARGSPKSS
ncbi:MAG TPA: cysteine hydrolase, partial [Myxococcaceae bacterium]|nr:cysteine hydrolase [Myxococcaceae bacterium]